MRTTAVLAMLLAAAVATRAAADDELPPEFRRLLPLHKPLPEPRPGDWLYRHEEPGQTYGEYLASEPVQADRQRRIIYLQLIGEFDENQQRVLDLTADYMRAYFQLPVRVRGAFPLDKIPPEARRKHPIWRNEQILTTYVLEELLHKRLPRDACAYLALTSADLWPGGAGSYVFGYATYRDRVGMYSIYRKGDPSEEFDLCLRRTLRLATHETGHMFSMLHCTRHLCNMCGSNHLDEADRHPLWLCPHCLAKLCHATGADPRRRFRALIGFFDKVGFDEEAAFMRKSLETMGWAE
jgi:archaemetzincin